VSNNTSRLLKVGVAVLCLVISLPVIYIGFLYLSYIDKTITSGTAYGFTIGQAKADVYRIAQLQFRDGDIEAIDTLRSRDEELKQFPEIIGDRHKVSEVRDWFESWNQWSLWLEGEKPVLLAVLKFHGDQLNHPWQAPNADDLGFRTGQSYSEAYSRLEALVTAHASMVVDTGWMARRQPMSFDDSEYRFVSEQDEWTLLVNDDYFNTVRLSFTRGRLSRIHRHRQYFELP